MAAAPSIGRASAVEAPPRAHEAELTRALYERHSHQLYGFCFAKLGSREEAEDAVQTTFLNAFRALERGVVPQAESAWLFKIAENVCLSRHRSSFRRRRVETPSDLEVLQEVVPAREHDGDELVGLERVLEQMPETQRRAILLREWQGLSYREIADEMELTQGAVETLIFRARRSLAQGLESFEKEDVTDKPLRRRARRGADAGALIAALKTFLGTAAGMKAAATVVAVGSATVIAAAPPSVRHELSRVTGQATRRQAPVAHRAPARAAARVATVAAASAVAPRHAPPHALVASRRASSPGLAARRAAPAASASVPEAVAPPQPQAVAAPVPLSVPVEPAPAVEQPQNAGPALPVAPAQPQPATPPVAKSIGDDGKDKSGQGGNGGKNQAAESPKKMDAPPTISTVAPTQPVGNGKDRQRDREKWKGTGPEGAQPGDRQQTATRVTPATPAATQPVVPPVPSVGATTGPLPVLASAAPASTPPAVSEQGRSSGWGGDGHSGWGGDSRGGNDD